MGNIIYLKNMKGDNEMANAQMEKVCVSDIDTISDYFLNKQAMTPKKLQKICYYAYAWYLTMYNERLFDDGKFQAWVHGPVNPYLYSKYKNYGWNKIDKKENVEVNEELSEFLDTIFNTFAGFTGDELENMTHRETPWIEQRKGYEPYEACTRIINDETIKVFYRNLMERSQGE